MAIDEALVVTRSSSERPSAAHHEPSSRDAAGSLSRNADPSGPRRSRWRGLRHGFASRLVAAILLVSVPLMLVLAAILTTQASDSLSTAARATGRAISIALTLRLETWESQRHAEMQVAAAAASGHLTGLATADVLAHLDKASGSYLRIDVVDLDGKTLTSSRAGSGSSVVGQDWFRNASAGKPGLTTLTRQGDHLQWIVAQPVLGADGKVQAVVVGALDPNRLSTLLFDAQLTAGTDVVVADSAHLLVYDSTGVARGGDASAQFEAAALTRTIDNTATRLATNSTEPGTARFVDASGRDVIVGYDVVDDLGWIVMVQRDASSVLAPVALQHRHAAIVVAIGAVLAVGVSAALAWWSTRPIRRLTEVARRVTDGDLTARAKLQGAHEIVVLSESFNEMVGTCHRLIEQVSAAGVEVNSAAAELSASSDQLAATTTQQSAAVIEATATTEELARSSAAIADTVDDVARQTAETRENLQQAEVDIALSSERTLVLAGRVNQIGALLDLINDISDQTNLLALNAAIEAARAGENGLGFAVVADEVRRLAERSKTSARGIAEIVSAVQGETNATVMAMEKGATQMQRGLTLLEAVTDANGQVRLTTHQQRSATAQVVETMEQLNDASPQVSATAQEIAAAAGNLADLAGTLESTAAAAAGNGRR